MARALTLHPDRPLPAAPVTRHITRTPSAKIAALTIVGPHEYSDRTWFTRNANRRDRTADGGPARGSSDLVHRACRADAPSSVAQAT